MSHPINDKYLEDMRDSFVSSESGFERCTVLKELQLRGFYAEAETLKEDWYEERKQFMADSNLIEDELLQDEDDPTIEFWYEWEEMGTRGDDYQFDKKRYEVPMYLNVDYWLDYKEII